MLDQVCSSTSSPIERRALQFSVQREFLRSSTRTKQEQITIYSKSSSKLLHQWFSIH